MWQVTIKAFADDAPVEKICLPAAGGASHSLFQLYEGRTVDGGFVTSQVHDLTRLRWHLRANTDAALALFLAGQVDEQVLNDDAEAVDISGTSWLEQFSILLDLRCQVPERPRAFVAKEMKNALVSRGVCLATVGSTYDVIHCRVLPVNDLDDVIPYR